jgi:hypothetical protein
MAGALGAGNNAAAPTRPPSSRTNHREKPANLLGQLLRLPRQLRGSTQHLTSGRARFLGSTCHTGDVARDLTLKNKVMSAATEALPDRAAAALNRGMPKPGSAD